MQKIILTTRARIVDYIQFELIEALKLLVQINNVTKF